MDKTIFDSILNELEHDANGYIGFDANGIETDDPCVAFTDYLLAEYKDKVTSVEADPVYNTKALAVSYKGKVIEITDSIQDNNVDYREIYFTDSKEGNLDLDPVVLGQETKMSDNRSGGGIGLGTLLFIIFLVLKLCGVIAWSWWWVTAPLWIPILLIIIFSIIIKILD